MRLEQFGWNDFFARQCVAGIPARVAWACRERFVVWTAVGEADVEVSGAMRFESRLWPVVGDWVVLSENRPVIEQVLERQTAVARRQPGREQREQVLAANVDVLFIVSGLDRDYNPRRLERYLVVARESGSKPVIVLNKTDLAQSLGLDIGAVVTRTRELAGGAPVIPLSAETDSRLDALSLKPGETAALIGSSGAGKSTILNRLLGKQQQSTGAVRTRDDRGRHTTTARELFMMPGGWQLIDMPGLREVGLGSGGEGVDASFPEIQEMAAACRFRDCRHAGEPGCAVMQAGMDEARLANYRKMRREQEFLERKADPEIARQTRAKWKAIHKAHRHDRKRDW